MSDTTNKTMFQATAAARNLVKSTTAKLTSSSNSSTSARSISSSSDVGSFAFYRVHSTNRARAQKPSTTMKNVAGGTNRECCFSYYSQQQPSSPAYTSFSSTPRYFSTDSFAFYPVQKNRIRPSMKKITRDCYSFYPSNGMDQETRIAMKQLQQAKAKSVRAPTAAPTASTAAAAEATKKAAMSTFSTTNVVKQQLPKTKPATAEATTKAKKSSSVREQFRNWDATTGIMHTMKKRSNIAQ